MFRNKLSVRTGEAVKATCGQRILGCTLEWAIGRAGQEQIPVMSYFGGEDALLGVLLVEAVLSLDADEVFVFFLPVWPDLP